MIDELRMYFFYRLQSPEERAIVFQNLINFSSTSLLETLYLINLIVRAGGDLQSMQEIKRGLHLLPYTAPPNHM